MNSLPGNDDSLNLEMRGVAIELTEEQVECVLIALEAMPENPVSPHLIDYLKFRYAAVKQELLLSLNRMC